MTRPLSIAAVLAAGIALHACTEAEMPNADEGRAFFMQNCAACHGASGLGDGPAAAAMTPPPADLTGIAARNGGTFPRAQVLSTIDGYAREGKRGMPAFGAALDGDLVPLDTGDGVLTPTPRELVALLEHLEAIQVP